LLAENPNLRKDSNRIKSIASEVVSKINEMTVAEQRDVLERDFPGEIEKTIARKKEISKADSEKKIELPDLPDAEFGKVVTRFPPEPNGYMHIGHAKATILGFEYAKKYQGKFIVRFDDTNPAVEKKEYYDAFLESFDWLGIKADLVRNASDDLTKYYEIARTMIQKYAAYVCACNQEKMRENRKAGVNCEHRSQTADQNFTLWELMVSGETEAKHSTLRFVGDMQSLNTTMRDPVLFRVVEHPHPLKGTLFRIWPTYDFNGPVEDSLDGVTHAMRSKEYELRDELYYAILDSANLRKPRIIEFSRLQLQNTTVSKRNLRKLIDEGKVKGWDDPRLPTISGLKRRGILPGAIREFVLSMGISKVESQPSWDLLESINRKLLDPIAKRLFYVENPVSLEIDGAPSIKVLLKFHPDEKFGSRTIETDGRFLISASDASQLKIGSKFRLIEVYNCEVYSIQDNLIKAKQVSDDNLERMMKVQWVVPEKSIPFRVTVTGPLLIDEVYNPDSLKISEGKAELSARDLKIGEMFQFVRFGFCRLDSPESAIFAHK